MYTIEKQYWSDTISVSFDTKIFPGARDAFVPLVHEYAEEYGLEIQAVDRFYQYKLIGDELDLRFRWNGNFTIDIYVPYKRNYAEAERRIRLLCNRLNNNLRKNIVRPYDPNI